jgi:16S rRNA U516 pseudouridylate synthase RsuA-like enzyme
MDINSEGLMILTNDNDVAMALEGNDSLERVGPLI